MEMGQHHHDYWSICSSSRFWPIWQVKHTVLSASSTKGRSWLYSLKLFSKQGKTNNELSSSDHNGPSFHQKVVGAPGRMISLLEVKCMSSSSQCLYSRLKFPFNRPLGLTYPFLEWKQGMWRHFFLTSFLY